MVPFSLYLDKGNLQCAEKQLSQFLERETLGENLYIVNGEQGFQS